MSSQTRVRVVSFVFLFLSSLPLTAMTLAVDGEGVTVGNLRPGARVVLFGVGREPHRDHSVVRRWTEVLADDDQDGIVRFVSAITNKSIWIAVDLASGTRVAETGPDYPRREMVPVEVLRRNSVGELSQFENARGVAELLVVRPGKGAWRVSGAKNAPVDEARGTTDPMRVDASSFQAVPDVESEELTHLERGDVIAMIDPRLMEFYLMPVVEE
jgi:hypothetical protein